MEHLSAISIFLTSAVFATSLIELGMSFLIHTGEAGHNYDSY